jgi:aminodeoxyfutalosine deaminase
VVITLNTDDPPLFNTTLNKEYKILVDSYGYDLDEVLRIARNGFLSSFADPETKAKLLSEFDSWVGQNGL